MLDDVLEVLRPLERTQLLTLAHRELVVSQTLAQLERILASQTFVRVQKRAREFLTFVVAMKLLRREHHVKETTVAMAVFGEGVDYSAAETSRVRVAAGDLRQRLEHYAIGEGRDDEQQITLPLHTYVPALQWRPLTITIGPFENWNQYDERNHFGIVLAEALVKCLAGQSGLIARSSSPELSASDFSLRGCYAFLNGHAKLHAVLSDERTHRVLSWRGFREPSDTALRLARRLHRLISALIIRRAIDNRPLLTTGRSATSVKSYD